MDWLWLRVCGKRKGRVRLLRWKGCLGCGKGQDEVRAKIENASDAWGKVKIFLLNRKRMS